MQRYFPTLNLKSGDRVFVPLCGKSIDMIWLAGQGYKVIGVEISQAACKAFFKENKIPTKKTEIDDFVIYTSDVITLISGDIFNLEQSILGDIDAVYDRAALIALPTELRQQYSMHLAQLLELNTPVFLITTAYDHTQMQGPPFSVDEHEVDTLYNQHFNIEQLYSKPLSEIPTSLHDKGLLHATEQVYSLVKKSPK